MTRFIAVVDDPADWKLNAPEVEVVAADRYLGEPSSVAQPRVRVINLCRSLRYQRTGYYVSLLAEARDHRPMPTVGTLQELRSAAVVRSVNEELRELIQKSLRTLGSDTFTLSIYFGRNVATRHEALAAALFRAFQAPLMRAHFRVDPRTKAWCLTTIAALDLKQVSAEHREVVVAAMGEYVAGRAPRARQRSAARYDLALLRDVTEPDPASDARAIQRFIRAGESVGFSVKQVGRHDLGRTAEFDALFIRDTTSINHYTYRFAMKAKAEGLVVMDDPDAILKCMNKVYLAELLQRHRIPAPRSMIVTRRNKGDVESTLGLPCVLKQPDSAFSMGVTKAATREELEDGIAALLEKSSLVIAQEFRPTEFDWRIGVLDGQPLYACRYFMAKHHWQILHHVGGTAQAEAGAVETVPVEAAPGQVLDLAVRAANLYGDGLFGVDLKVLDGQVVVIEVNDNPTIDAGDEDAVLGQELYLRIMRHLMGRVEQRKRAGRFR